MLSHRSRYRFSLGPRVANQRPSFKTDTAIGTEIMTISHTPRFLLAPLAGALLFGLAGFGLPQHAVAQEADGATTAVATSPASFKQDPSELADSEADSERGGAPVGQAGETSVATPSDESEQSNPETSALEDKAKDAQASPPAPTTATAQTDAPDGDLATADQASDDAAPLVAALAANAQPSLSEAQRAAFEACEQHAAPQQYGGPAFNDLQPDLALAACTLAWQQVPSKIAVISAYIGRTLEAQGQMEAAYWLYKRAASDGLPVGYGLMAYRLMRLANDDSKAAEYAETGHALGDWNASNVLATLYAQERIEGKGPEDALALIEYVAEQGSPFAQYLTAWLYETHANDASAALRWYERAVENGENAAAAFLADLLERGVAQQSQRAALEPTAGEQASAQSSSSQPDVAQPDESKTNETPPQPIASDADFQRAAALYWQALERGDSWAEQQFTQRGNQRSSLVIMEIQRRLADAGFNVGPADGVFGRKTERAIRDLVAQAASR